jgi:hypothetical protein
MSLKTLVTVFPATHARETGSIKKCIGLENTHQTHQTLSPPSPDASEWVLTFRPLADAIPSELRIRRLLKFALRSLKLRCVRLGQPPASSALKTVSKEKNDANA